MKSWTALLLSLGLVGTAQSAEFEVGTLTIDHPWSRSTPPVAQTGAAYFTVHNGGDEGDRLLSAEADVVDLVQLHTHRMEEGIMRMRQVEVVELPPGEHTVFQPGGLHVMLIGLNAPLAEGGSFPLTLNFEHAGSVTVEVEIQHPSANAPVGSSAMKHEGGATH